MDFGDWGKGRDGDCVSEEVPVNVIHRRRVEWLLERCRKLVVKWSQVRNAKCQPGGLWRVVNTLHMY